MAWILVVDDNVQILEICVSCLVDAGKGYDIASAYNGRHALKWMEKETFDLVLTDFQMPEMKGDELSIVIKEKYPAVPVIIMTGTKPPEAHKADKILKKPFKSADLLDLVKELLRD